MKTLIKKFAMLLLPLLMSCTNVKEVNAAPGLAINFQLFYDELSPYGTWVSYPSYGYAWVPGVTVGFRPYLTEGRWVYTDMGWTWVSYYDWGWAPYHYGNWMYDDMYGWMWIPGYDWAPAWVTWGYYGGYYGWAPLAPGISFSIGYYPPIDYWVFASPQYITTTTWSNNYYVASGGRIPIDNNTNIEGVNKINIVNNTNTFESKTYHAGPPRQEFEKAAKTTLQPVALKEMSKPGKTELSGSAVNVYRPKVNSESKSAAKPSKVIPLENLKKVNRNIDGKPAQEVPNKNNIETRPEAKPAPAEREQIKKQPEQRKPEVNPAPEKPEMKKPQREPQPETRPAPEQKQPKEQQQNQEARPAPENKQPPEQNPKQEEQIQKNAPQKSPDVNRPERRPPPQPHNRPAPPKPKEPNEAPKEKPHQQSQGSSQDKM